MKLVNLHRPAKDIYKIKINKPAKGLKKSSYIVTEDQIDMFIDEDYYLDITEDNNLWDRFPDVGNVIIKIGNELY